MQYARYITLGRSSINKIGIKNQFDITGGLE